MSSAELAEWRAYQSIEMLPDERIEFLLGLQATLLANIHRSEDTEPFAINDFLPWLQEDDDDEPDGLSQADVIALVENLNAVFGGRDERDATGSGVRGDGGHGADATGHDDDDGEPAGAEDGDEPGAG
ncbi:MAG: hypothetical protein IPK78_18110 [Rhodospirillales bacterium]|nr:hypothetical protein [Rhodospirillales bacterium]